MSITIDGLQFYRLTTALTDAIYRGVLAGQIYYLVVSAYTRGKKRYYLWREIGARVELITSANNLNEMQGSIRNPR